MDQFEEENGSNSAGTDEDEAETRGHYVHVGYVLAAILAINSSNNH